MDYALTLALKYGPQLVADLIEALKKKGITVAEVEAMFADVKPYEALNIKDPNSAQP